MKSVEDPNAPNPRDESPALDGMSPRGPEEPSEVKNAFEFVSGERGIPSVSRVRSMQSRVTAFLAIGFISLMALGLLGWYYSRAFNRVQARQHTAQKTAQERAKGEMVLPPLGHIESPHTPAPPAAPAPPMTDQPTALQSLLGPPPELPPVAPTAVVPAIPNATTIPGPPRPTTLERQLGGPVFSSERASTPEPAHTVQVLTPAEESAASANAPASSGRSLGEQLRPTVTPAVQARVLPTQRFLLAKGAFIDCTLETAIDSTLPGLVTCITATDAFGVDGTTVLIERGSKLVGETQGDVHQGAARVFVLWTEVRTPSGVVVALASPGTDELGRAGLPGEVNRHFFQRFGAAMLISIIEGAVQGATERTGNGGAVIVNPSGASTITTEVLRGTVDIPPTLTKNQGDRIQVLIARDLDFRSVYELRSASAR